jgi:hypothetical protein
MPQEELVPAELADMAALGKILNDHRAERLAMLRRRLDRRLARRLDPEDNPQLAFGKAGAFDSLDPAGRQSPQSERARTYFQQPADQSARISTNSTSR